MVPEGDAVPGRCTGTAARYSPDWGRLELVANQAILSFFK